MKSFITLLLLILFTLPSLQAQNWGWNRKTVTGNGEVITQDRNLKGFTGIDACCNMRVELTPGPAFSVTVEAESNLQEFIQTNVSGSRLEIDFKDRVNINSNKKIIVYVTLPKLESIDASSSANIVTTAAFKGERLRLESSSNSRVEAIFMGEKVVADASSGARIEVSGSAGYINAEASSGSNVYAGNLKSKEGRADVSSGAGIELNVSEKLNADASSGGRVRYEGNPTQVDTDVSSGGSVKKG